MELRARGACQSLLGVPTEGTLVMGFVEGGVGYMRGVNVDQYALREDCFSEGQLSL